MNLLQALGIASMAFVVAFTVRAYALNPGAGQSPRSAIIEAWFNIAIGFTINFIMNLLVIPLAVHGGHLSAADNWWMGWVFTTISIVRQYAIRRWFNARLHAAAKRLAGDAA
jgi:hypothetical protein